MKVLSLCIFIQSVVCVFVEDAFTKNWVSYNHGNPVEYGLLGPEKLLVKTDKQEVLVYGFDFGGEKVMQEWKVDVPFAFEYFVGHKTVFVYNKEYIYLYDTETGALYNYYKVGVKKIFEAFDGVVVLTGDGNVVFVDVVNAVEIPGLNAGDLVVSEERDEVLIITDSSVLVKLQSDLSYEEKAVDIKFSKITGFKGKLVAVSDGVYDILKGNYVIKQKNLIIHNDHIFYSFNGDLRIYNDDKLVLSDKFKNVQFLGDKVVGDDDERKVLDMSKFYETFDESSIVLDTYTVTSPGKDYLFEGVIYTVSFSDGIVITKYDPIQDISTIHSFELETYNLSGVNSLLINKPESEQTLESIQHLIDEINQNGLVTRWLKRSKRHLVELGKFVVSFVKKVELDKIDITNPYDIEKLLAYIDGDTLTTVDSLDGKPVWTRPINSGVVRLEEVDGGINLVYKDEIVSVSARDGSFVGTAANTIEYNEQFHYIKQEKDTVQGYKFSTQLMPTWKYSNGQIIKVTVKPAHQHASLGIAQHDKSVLYKYMNDNLISVLSYNNGLQLAIIDGQTGSILHKQFHDEEIDLSTVNVIMDDNWVIYSYFVTSPKYEQRITVVDLFKGHTIESSSKSLKSSVDSTKTYKEPIETTSKTYIYPEAIVDMKSTYTKFGITIKSIIILTKSGDLIEVPKFILNSRRIDDKVLTPDDFKDDFRMSPYEPIVPRNNYQVLNHQHKLKVGQFNNILIKDTKLESTTVVCFLNEYNKFCTRIQPSSSFDILGEQFDKFKLIITMVVLIVGYFITKPMVIKKNLNNQWVYAL